MTDTSNGPEGPINDDSDEHTLSLAEILQNENEIEEAGAFWLFAGDPRLVEKEVLDLGIRFVKAVAALPAKRELAILALDDPNAQAQLEALGKALGMSAQEATNIVRTRLRHGAAKKLLQLAILRTTPRELLELMVEDSGADAERAAAIKGDTDA